MKKIAVVTDSTAYIPDAFVKKYNIHVIPIRIHWEGSWNNCPSHLFRDKRNSKFC
jgi:fatty acid-binding protein DegV